MSGGSHCRRHLHVCVCVHVFLRGVHGSALLRLVRHLNLVLTRKRSTRALMTPSRRAAVATV